MIEKEKCQMNRYQRQSFVKNGRFSFIYICQLVFEWITVLRKQENRWWPPQVDSATQKGHLQFGQHTLGFQLHFSTSNFSSNTINGSIVMVNVVVRREGKRDRRCCLSPIEAHGSVLTGSACCPLSSFSVDMRSNSNSFIRFSFSGSSSLQCL